MSDRQYKFNVQMACGGCSSAVKEAVEALSGEFPGALLYHDHNCQGTNVFVFYVTGVKNLFISMEEQTVSVGAKSSLSYETVLGAIKAKGKNVRYGEADGVAQSV